MNEGLLVVLGASGVTVAIMGLALWASARNDRQVTQRPFFTGHSAFDGAAVLKEHYLRNVGRSLKREYVALCIQANAAARRAAQCDYCRTAFLEGTNRCASCGAPRRTLA